MFDPTEPYPNDHDGAAMKRRDDAASDGAQICPRCDGTGEIEDAFAGTINVHRCPQCEGETWVTANGTPYKID